MTILRSSAITDMGQVRETNQDSVLEHDPLFAVADGMGGHQGGEVASAVALEVLNASFTTPHTVEALIEAVRRANAKVWDKAQLTEDLRGMGTTLTAVAKVVAPDGEQESLAIANVGDSRAYLFHDGELRQITEDHSIVEEMVRAGEITAEEALHHPRRNILTRALGVEPTIEVDIEELPCRPGDRILLCSDGLVRELNDDQISAVLRRLRNSQEAAQELVTQAKAHGGHDNITVLVVDVEAETEGHVAAPVDPSSPTGEATLQTSPRTTHPVGSPETRHITARVMLFVTALVAVVVMACGAVVWYARAPFYVGLEGQHLVIYRGRPQPVLWFHATITERTDINVATVLASNTTALQAGVTQPSLGAAHRYIDNLVSQATAAQQVAGSSPGTSAPITSAPATTPTVPTTVLP